jgi:CO dehydrogenase/acetyl-CoA synthase epsilon subunit
MTSGDIIKIGTTDVVIQGNNEGIMIFGKSAKLDEETPQEQLVKLHQKYSMPQWCPSGLTRSQKRKLHHLRAKESR